MGERFQADLKRYAEITHIASIEPNDAGAGTSEPVVACAGIGVLSFAPRDTHQFK
jgi:hypothetical protein